MQIQNSEKKSQNCAFKNQNYEKKIVLQDVKEMLYLLKMHLLKRSQNKF